MMSDQEMQSIDDWRFANRVMTRSDAVRRLTLIALMFDGDSEAILEKMTNLHGSFFRFCDQLLDLRETDAAFHEQTRKLMPEFARLVDLVHGTHLDILAIASPARSLRVQPEMSDALEEAARAKAQMSEYQSEYAEIIRDADYEQVANVPFGEGKRKPPTKRKARKIVRKKA
jgi:hypothetical protein